jgi:hypothetical protein
MAGKRASGGRRAASFMRVLRVTPVARGAGGARQPRLPIGPRAPRARGAPRPSRPAPAGPADRRAPPIAPIAPVVRALATVFMLMLAPARVCRAPTARRTPGTCRARKRDRAPVSLENWRRAI